MILIVFFFLGVMMWGDKTPVFHSLFSSSVFVVQVECGLNHAAFLTSKREVFVLGSNTFGQLGLPR